MDLSLLPFRFRPVWAVCMPCGLREPLQPDHFGSNRSQMCKTDMARSLPWPIVTHVALRLPPANPKQDRVSGPRCGQTVCDPTMGIPLSQVSPASSHGAVHRQTRIMRPSNWATADPNIHNCICSPPMGAASCRREPPAQPAYTYYPRRPPGGLALAKLHIHCEGCCPWTMPSLSVRSGALLGVQATQSGHEPTGDMHTFQRERSGTGHCRAGADGWDL